MELQYKEMTNRITNRIINRATNVRTNGMRNKTAVHVHCDIFHLQAKDATE
jgi:hypothetical protein